MARIRSVKPEYWLDRKLARGASRDARLLYIGLWNYADEHGRLHGDPAVIKGQVFPYDDIAVTPLLEELVGLGRVQAYQFEGDPYLFLPMLGKHQRLEPNKAKSRLPDPPQPSSEPNVPSSQGHSEKTVAESAPIAAEPEPIVVQQVAGSRLQVASGRLHGAGTRSPAKRSGPERTAANAATIVAAYVEGAREAGQPEPAGSLCARVGKQAKAMLATNELAALAKAARSMGAAGWHDLAVQHQRDAAGARGQPSGGFKPFQNPADQSVYDQPLEAS
jgi:hypothetical protein